MTGDPPAGVAAEEAQLELLHLLVRDRHRDEAPEPGVDAVGVLLVDGPLDELTGGFHLRPGRLGEADRGPVDRHLPDVLDPQIVARQGVVGDHRPVPAERALIGRV